MKNILRIIMAILALIATLGAIGETAFAAEIPGFAIRTTAEEVRDEAEQEFTVPRATTIQTHYFPITAYSSAPNQTDASPYITADGSVVEDGIIATNYFPFGTKVRIPQYFGDKIFTVHDRMNARYWKRIDIWVNDINVARQWGYKRNVVVEVIEMGNNKKSWDQWKGRTADLLRIGKYGPDA